MQRNDIISEEQQPARFNRSKTQPEHPIPRFVDISLYQKRNTATVITTVQQQQTHIHLHHHNYHPPMDRHHHHHPHGDHHSRRKHRLVSTVSLCVLLTGCLTWLSAVNVSQLLVVDPRKLMSDTQETSTGGGDGRHATLGSAILLRSQEQQRSAASLMGPLEEILIKEKENLTKPIITTDKNHSWSRVVYLEGDAASWRDSRTTQRSYLIPTYPRIIAPGEGRGTNQDDDVEPESLQDFTRWYPQIDSSDERFHIERTTWPEHEIDPDHCHPMHAWQSTSFPVCNTIHEKNMLRSVVEQDLYMISKKGFWRHAWGSSDIAKHKNATATPKKMVWKTFKIQHSMEDAFFENNRVDALAMERLTASPHVIDIYGFCSMTVIQEYAGRQLHEQKLDPVQSLDLAIRVASGIRDIHYVGDSALPALVHNDINLANIIVTDDGRPVINDFNIAVLMMRHDSSSAACPFYARFPNPQWRSPEEQVESEEESRNDPPIVDEKIDIYALGNVLYRLVAGGSPWKKKGFPKLTPEEKMEVAIAKRYNGTLPPIPAGVHLDDPASAALYEAMKMCYRFDPNERPSAKQVVEFLESARSKLL